MKIKPTQLITLAIMLPCIANADVDCEKVVLAGQTYATSQTTFEGDALSNLGRIGVSVQITSSRQNPDGSINATTTHTLSYLRRIVGTNDRARLVPLNDSGLYRLDTQAVISDYYFGHLKIDGLVNFATGEARWIAEGHICEPSTS